MRRLSFLPLALTLAFLVYCGGSAIAQDAPVAKKAADILGTMLKKLDEAGSARIQMTGNSDALEQRGEFIPSWQRHTGPGNSESSDPMAGLSISSKLTPKLFLLLSSSKPG